jgi:hypothetical protein
MSGTPDCVVDSAPLQRAAPLVLMLVAMLPAAFSGVAFAARPMITDDARITDPKACQVESWARHNRDSSEYWALPACNFSGNLELTLGGSRTDSAGELRTTDVLMQGKTLFRKLAPNGWGIGLVAGNQRRPLIHPGDGLAGDVYAYVPASFSFREDRLVLHTNLGGVHDRTARRHRMTWGVGSETQLAGNTWLIAESFGQNQGKPFLQFGLRHWIVPGHVQIDATYGNRWGRSGDERWVSIGVRLISAAILP